MKLRLTVKGVEKEVELGVVLKGDAGDCRFRIDSTERTAAVETVCPGIYSILIDGVSYDASVEHTPEGMVVAIAGEHFEISVHDPRRWSPKSAGGTHGVATLTSPMPGKVVRVLVAAGDAVEAGQGVLVVEAMKMQNELKAPRSGHVISVTAREGATVAAGESLATIG
ncbi:MAG TPA: biotin/lipoyl-containing protein [Bryobacteraceae bacterium]